ncbi:unnamed protein product [Mytilus edulis]|uniref:Uncharacterized protein n=1 Tax=Mytilus edulis TaxID=6550 RepID=A0A8S3UDB4_MYTED|nr:unnamed protein product [Mytilus edulis]
MADAMIQSRDKKSEKTPDKKASSVDDDYLRLEDEDALLFDKPKESKTRSKTSKASSKSAAQDILKQIRSEQVKTNCRIDNMHKRIDALYDEEYQYDDENQNESDCYDDACDEVQADNEKRDEPPSKKQKSDSCEETRFASMSKKFRSGEKYAPSINEQLANNITDIFRNGISSERFSDLMKDEKLQRPQKCDGLVTVQTDQSVVVKTATVMAKVINKLDLMLEKKECTEHSNMLDDCMDSLALMVHANRLVCLMRRTLMKYDIIGEYGHLLNATVPYDKNLFGGDVVKTVDDIGKCSRKSNKIRERVSTVALIEAVVDLGILGSLVEAQAVVEVTAVVEHLVQAQIRLENKKTPGGLTTNTDIKT